MLLLLLLLRLPVIRLQALPFGSWAVSILHSCCLLHRWRLLLLLLLWHGHEHAMRLRLRNTSSSCS
jgi:hypothetical protein